MTKIREKTTRTGGSLEDTLVALEKVALKTPALLFTEEQNIIDRYIIQLAEGELFTAVTIVRVLLEIFLETGETEYYRRSWFCDRFPWRRSKMTEKLLQLVTEGILFHNKRQYSLNVCSPFVQRTQRTMRLEQFDIDFEELLEECSREVIRGEETKEEKRQVTEQQLVPKKKQAYRITTRREQKQFVKELRTTYIDNLQYLNEEELEKELRGKIEKQILQTIGIIENK